MSRDEFSHEMTFESDKSTPHHNNKKMEQFMVVQEIVITDKGSRFKGFEERSKKIWPLICIVF